MKNALNGKIKFFLFFLPTRYVLKVNNVPQKAVENTQKSVKNKSFFCFFILH